MKTKAFIVYVALGVAFAAVSLWVFLSKGKNAKAIRTKYKLGGAFLPESPSQFTVLSSNSFFWEMARLGGEPFL